ncbi:trypsin-2-like [Misgurnus anguillicaudatus]|uniref:trypsin-2-like n=1 Tax=Misgurnus anguillicaudatus TaxID=75329 RepID=UPI003CCF50DA
MTSHTNAFLPLAQALYKILSGCGIYPALFSVIAMKTIVFALLVVAVAASTDDGKIIGGFECAPHSQPWQAYLTYDGIRLPCSASLINEYWLVSAAQCYVTASRLVVHLGEHNLLSDEGTEQQSFVDLALQHPNYNNVYYNNDIMLIKLRTPAVFNNYVKPIPLATSCSYTGEKCLVSGWGDDGENYKSVLQCLNLPVISWEECEAFYRPSLTTNMFCAGDLKEGKACQGDPGGPFVCNGKLQGVVSWAYNCGSPSNPGVYVEVCHYIDWINDIMELN